METQEFGKTTFISVLSKLSSKKKILIIDFDLIAGNIHSVFGVKEIQRDIKEKLKNEEFLEEFKLKESNIKNLKIKVDRNIDLISKTSIIFDQNYNLKEERIQNMLESVIENYDVILIDTSSDTKYRELTKVLAKLSDKVICLIEGNIVNIRRTANLLKEYDSINKKIRLVYNKKSEYTLSMKILKIIFLKFKMIGKLRYDNSYNKIINKSVKRLYISKKIREEFAKLKKAI